VTTLGIRCFSHADIGLDRRVGSDGLKEWLDSGATGLDQVAPVPPFQRLPVQALLDHGADALLLLVAGESGSPFERAASMFGSIVQESTGIPVHVAALEFGLERFRDATTKFVQGLGMGRASEAGVLVGVGPGAAQLTLGTILGSLAASPSVSLIHCVSGARIDHAVVPDPSTWLERRRFFERLAQLADANGDEQRARAIREMDEALIHLDDHIRLEAEFFDAVARGSVRSVVMGRAWLTSGYLARGGLMAMDRSNRPSLGVTLALIPADTPLAARTFLKTFAFLNPIATGNAGHRARELRYANERRLSKHEREGGLERAGLPVRRFRATPSGLVHVVRCVGEREMLEGGVPVRRRGVAGSGPCALPRTAPGRGAVDIAGQRPVHPGARATLPRPQ